MHTKQIFRQIYRGYLVVTLLSLSAVFFLSSTFLSRSYQQKIEENLYVQALFAEEQIRDRFDASHIDELCEISERLGEKTAARITFVLSDGTVAGDSETAPAEMGNHRDRPEILEALGGRPAQSVRYSATLRKSMMYVAVPVFQEKNIAGVVRTSMPLTRMDQVIKVVRHRILFGGLIILLLAALLSLLVSRRISRPLAESMNTMAVQLEERLRSLNRLEKIRRDFVANVSHELKTPITSIKGFVETLLDGAINDPAEADRFLKIVSKQANRLNAIIEDLLALSRLEQGGETDVDMQSVGLSGLLHSAAEACSRRAGQKDITINVDCRDGLSAVINPQLIEQALINLIGNAVKYSEADSAVVVHAYTEADETILSVKDQGCGIEDKHIDRLFERFYRVDKGRSRQEGSTGLGLAIVKHIAQVHGGRVDVQSTFGQGSVFSIFLPIA